MNSQTIPDGFDYYGAVYRPPNEADSIIIQATIGCSHNKCTFCGAYHRKKFALKDRDVVAGDLLFAREYCKRQDKVFIIDGNALTMPMERWEWLLAAIKNSLPWVKRVRCYGTAMDIAAKSDEDLKRLRDLGLTGLYVGVESGHAQVLSNVCKGVDPAEMLRQCRRVVHAGVYLSVSIVLGIAGEELSLANAQMTGELLSAIDPHEVGITMLLPQAGTFLRKAIKQGAIAAPDSQLLIAELRELLMHTHLNGGLFDASHSSSYVNCKLRLPGDRQAGLEHIDQVLSGQTAMKPDGLRRI